MDDDKAVKRDRVSHYVELLEEGGKTSRDMAKALKMSVSEFVRWAGGAEAREAFAGVESLRDNAIRLELSRRRGQAVERLGMSLAKAGGASDGLRRCCEVVLKARLPVEAPREATPDDPLAGYDKRAPARAEVDAWNRKIDEWYDRGKPREGVDEGGIGWHALGSA